MAKKATKKTRKSRHARYLQRKLTRETRKTTTWKAAASALALIAMGTLVFKSETTRTRGTGTDGTHTQADLHFPVPADHLRHLEDFNGLSDHISVAHFHAPAAPDSVNHDHLHFRAERHAGQQVAHLDDLEHFESPALSMAQLA